MSESIAKKNRWWARARAAATSLAFPLLLMAAAGGADGPQAPVSIDRQDALPYQISVNVDLVVLHASVRDRKGQYAPDLRERHFEVYEDGVRQSIRLFRHERTPVTVGLVVDHSGSTRYKLPQVIAAARTFVRLSSPNDEMFVVNFNENVTLGLPEAIAFTSRADDLALAISNTPAAGMTALYDAVAMGIKRLEAGSRDKKALIVISDGGDNASSLSLAEVLKLAEQSNAIIYTIGVFDEEDPDRNPGVLKRLAHSTGGEAHFPGPLNAAEACERIARDIRHHYTIGYISTNTGQAGTYRNVKVTARAAGKSRLAVRTRSGYTSGSELPPVSGVVTQ